MKTFSKCDIIHTIDFIRLKNHLGIKSVRRRKNAETKNLYGGYCSP